MNKLHSGRMRRFLFSRKIAGVATEFPKSKSGGLVLTTLEGVIKGGEFGPSVDLKNPANSLLLKMTSHQDKDHEMPPDGKMADEDIAVLAKWIELGVPFPEADEVEPKGEIVHHGADYEKGKQHWGFKKADKPTLPDESIGSHPIDRFVNHRLEMAQLPSNGRAEDHVLIRRVYYDLTGLPPSPAEVEAYVRDQNHNKFSQLIDRLLASPHYGEKWGRHWLGLVRYAETNGYERDGNKPEIWRYRDYVIDSFNQNKPYDRLVLEHIARMNCPMQMPHPSPPPHISDSVSGMMNPQIQHSPNSITSMISFVHLVSSFWG